MKRSLTMFVLRIKVFYRPLGKNTKTESLMTGDFVVFIESLCIEAVEAFNVLKSRWYHLTSSRLERTEFEIRPRLYVKEKTFS